jgi:hypothetical protein
MGRGTVHPRVRCFALPCAIRRNASMTPCLSMQESRRFGLRIGRIAEDEVRDVDRLAAQVEDAFRLESLDVLILRVPAGTASLPARLASLGGIRAIPADTLLYWEWRAGPGCSDATAAEQLTDVDVLEQLVAKVFPGYPNHYVANPLLSAEGALAGYCEWAVTLLGSGGSTCLIVRSEVGAITGFGIIDWTPEVPDVRLAGIMPEARGRGEYRRLVKAMMAHTVSREGARLQISTQAHNIVPMRAWAHLGWQPLRTLTTTHLVREDLIRVGAG